MRSPFNHKVGRLINAWMLAALLLSALFGSVPAVVNAQDGGQATPTAAVPATAGSTSTPIAQPLPSQGPTLTETPAPPEAPTLASTPTPPAPTSTEKPTQAPTQTAKPTEKTSDYLSVQSITAADGTPLRDTIINGPPVPPPGFEAQRAAVELYPQSAMTLPDVPAFTWVFGCSSVSAAMIAGYYDRNGYSNIYTGPTNGGVMPLTDSSWSRWTDVSTSYPNNPLIASHNGSDGRSTSGSIDDYWVQYGSIAKDPFITKGWSEHTWGDAIGDYMKTSQSTYLNSDGSTSFYGYPINSADKLTCSAMEGYGIADHDGTYGRKLFYEARGYTVTDCYSQNTDNNVSGGFSLADFKAEIDAGHPVLLNLAGHSIVGLGYDSTSSTIYIHDTWDTSTHFMDWGGSYSGMALQSVSVVDLAAGALPGAFNKSSPANGSSGISISPTLSWGSSTGATSYDYCYDTSNDGACSGSWTNVGAATNVNLSGLNNGATYYWQVRAHNASGSVAANSGAWWSFATLPANNPVPSLSSINPTGALVGGAEFTLTANGSNFIHGSIVRWNGADLNTTFVSSTQLTAAVPANNLILATTIPITVFNPGPGGGTSDPQTFTINNRLPVLGSISPGAITTGEGAFTLILGGANFAAASKVRWNGADLATTFDSVTELKAAVSADRIVAAGTASISVFSPAPGGGTSQAIAFNIVAISPANGSTALTTRPTLDWQDTPGATAYTVQVSTTSSFSSYLVNNTVTLSKYALTADLARSKWIYWRVYPKGVTPTGWSETYKFFSANPPGVPVLSLPVNASLVTGYTPRLDWSTATLPAGTTFDHYWLQIASDAGFTSIVQDFQLPGLATSEKTLTTSLAPNGNYFWRVNAYNTAGQYSLWSSVRSFRTAMLPPGLLLPANLDTAKTTRPAFSWKSVDKATSYTIQVSSVSSFSTTLVNTSVSAPTYTPTSDLPRSKPLYWRVRANGTNPSAWAGTFSFTSANPPAVPGLLAPADGVTLSIYSPTLDWNDPSGAATYEVQIATASTFASGIVADNTSTSAIPSSFTPTSPLAANSTFYWRVRVYNSGGQYSNWSSVRHFHTTLATPVLATPANGDVTNTLPTFEWNDGSGASGYAIQVSTSPSFTALTINKVVTGSTYVSTSKLSVGKKYYWRVQAKGTYNSPWSVVGYFTTQ